MKRNSFGWILLGTLYFSIIPMYFIQLLSTKVGTTGLIMYLLFSVSIVIFFAPLLIAGIVILFSVLKNLIKKKKDNLKLIPISLLMIVIFSLITTFGMSRTLRASKDLEYLNQPIVITVDQCEVISIPYRTKNSNYFENFTNYNLVCDSIYKMRTDKNILDGLLSKKQLQIKYLPNTKTLYDIEEDTIETHVK